MPTWLFEVLFFGSVIGVIAWSIFWRIAVFTAAGNVYEAVTRKPTSPAPVDTPEEMADRVTRVKAMLAQAEASRLAHHH